MWPLKILIAGLLGLLLPACETDKNPDGSFNVGTHEVNTQKMIEEGSVVVVKATGLVYVGGAVGRIQIGPWVIYEGANPVNVGPDGESLLAPDDYPSPSLRKNSLIWKVGELSPWQQGGQCKSSRSSAKGSLILAPNDKLPEDNSGTWRVEVSISTGELDCPTGNFVTQDNDEIRYEITPGVTGVDAVNFQLCLKEGLTWTKIMNLPDGLHSSWNLTVEDDRRCDSESLWAEQVLNGQSLTFIKRKGVLSPTPYLPVYSLPLSSLGKIPPGSGVKFVWWKDN